MNETRIALIDATRRCLADHGIAGTTSRSITARAGANLAAITYHFGSKEQLVTEALLSSLRQWLQPAIDVLASDREPTTRTVLAMQTLITTFDAHRDELGLYLEAMALGPRVEAVGAGVVALWRELGDLIADQVREMSAAGELPDWVDAPAMASLVVAVANGLLVQVTLDREGPTLGAMAGQFSSLLLEARR